MVLIMIAAALVAATLVPGLAAASGNTATVNVSIASRTQVTRVGSALLVRSNAAWRVVLTTPDDMNTIVGGKTNGTRIEIPADATEYWVVTE